jgi:23S rRNA pseudouridine2604 synthase
MCAQVGLELLALRRLRIGRIAMAGLPVGQWRYLPAGERF